MGSAYSDIGPVLPSRMELHLQAVELLNLAKRAVEFSTAGPRCDVALAKKQLDHMRTLLGGE